jgi:arsenate reductase (thioredoxin)
MFMNENKPFKILFLCTGNSARSIFGEYLIRRMGKGRFESYSAGPSPRDKVNPYSQRVLKDAFKIDASDARSKSWDEFKRDGPVFDFVITVCDNVREICPVWPGQPIIAHWSTPDPAEFRGSDQDTYQYFWKVAQMMARRIDLLCNLPIDKLDRLKLERATKDIGTQVTEL